MLVRWSKQAAEDLDEIVDYIALDRPETARRVASKLNEEVDTLGRMPWRGRPGGISGTRELVLASTGHIVTYEVDRDAVRILRVRHGRRRRLS